MLANYDAVAYIKGNRDFTDIMGTVGFKGTSDGTWVDVDIKGLPPFKEETDEEPQTGPHGFHIHSMPCGNDYAEAGEHFDKGGNPHGNHSGDMPNLMPADGRARMLFFTNKFSPDEIIGKSVMVHRSPDDFKTQPSGGSGDRIACGTIEKY